MLVDAFNKGSSGGRVALRSAKLLMDLGHNVNVYDFYPVFSNESKIVNSYTQDSAFIKKNSINKVSNLVIRRNHLVNMLSEFRIDYLYYLSWTDDKPFLTRSQLGKIKVIVQPFGPNYYCYINFGVRNGIICSACITTNGFGSITFRCGPKFRYIWPLKITRRKLYIPLIYKVISSNTRSDDNLVSFGFSSQQIHRCQLSVDYYRASASNTPFARRSGVIFYGQEIEEKGFHLLPEIVKSLPEIPFVIFISKSASSLESTLLLQNFPNCKVHIGQNWETGIKERLSNSRLLLIPSIWDTTPETVLLEGLASKIPIVCFNVGWHQDYLKDNESAFVVGVGNISLIIEKIRLYYHDEEKLTYVADNGHEVWKEKFSNKSIRNSLGKIFC